MEIRFTERKDLKQLPWLYRQYYNGDSKLETNIDGMLFEYDNLKNNQDYKFISAVEEDKLIGFCSIVVNHDIVEKQKPILMIWNLRIHPEHRSKGIGSQMLKFIENFGRSINADLIMLSCDNENQRARNFYKKQGYGEDYSFFKYL